MIIVCKYVSLVFFGKYFSIWLILLYFEKLQFCSCEHLLTWNPVKMKVSIDNLFYFYELFASVNCYNFISVAMISKKYEYFKVHNFWLFEIFLSMVDEPIALSLSNKLAEKLHKHFFNLKNMYYLSVHNVFNESHTPMFHHLSDS